jgi:hypothetical protein
MTVRIVTRATLCGALALALALALAGCGGSDDATGPSNSASLTALAGDVAFSAGTVTATRTGGALSIVAEGASGGTTRTLAITLQASAVGSFTIGSASGPVLTYTELASGTTTAKAWSTSGTGTASGTLTITELSSVRAIGTFVATLPPVTSSGATQPKALTSGTFNVTLATSNGY